MLCPFVVITTAPPKLIVVLNYFKVSWLVFCGPTACIVQFFFLKNKLISAAVTEGCVVLPMSRFYCRPASMLHIRSVGRFLEHR